MIPSLLKHDPFSSDPHHFDTARARSARTLWKLMQSFMTDRSAVRTPKLARERTRVR